LISTESNQAPFIPGSVAGSGLPLAEADHELLGLVRGNDLMDVKEQPVVDPVGGGSNTGDVEAVEMVEPQHGG
jgi:hypothetical protein